LGLSITRALVEQHGGRIWLESEHGQGSRFILTIPAGKPDMAHAGP
jgi:signal transduction histidine kinase